MLVTNAFGQAIKPLCFTVEHDALFALGYPHLARLVDGHRDNQRPLACALGAATSLARLRAYRGQWPREVAHRFVRLAKTGWFQNWLMTAPTPAELAEPVAAGPVSEDEARNILTFAVAQVGCVHLQRVTSVNLLLEAMVGAEVVVDAIVSAMEALPPERFLLRAVPDRQLGEHFLDVGFVLLRLPAARRAHHRARLDALRARYFDASVAYEVVAPLDRVLRGAAAFDGPIVPYDYLDWHLFADDVSHLHEVIARPSTIYAGLDPRFVYLAGVEALDLIGKRRALSAEVVAWLGDLGMIRDPRVVALHVEYWGRSAAKTVPEEWLRANWEYARPIVERLAAHSGAIGQKASAALGALP